MLQISRVFAVLVLGGVLLVVTPHAATLTAPDAKISGGGIFSAIDDFGGSFPNAGQLSISAGLGPDGTPYGSIDLVGRGDFAAAWGACPYDPRCEDFPNTSTKTFHLSGEVNNVTALGSDVVATGLLTEVDHGKGNGVIFYEADVQFNVTASEGSNSLVFQFCFVPAMTLEITTGNLAVSTGGPQASLFQRPARGLTGSHALPCQEPAPRQTRVNPSTER